MIGHCWRTEEGGWGCTHWDGMVEGKGDTLEEAVHDLCAGYLAIFLRETDDDEVVMMMENQELKFLGPMKADPTGMMRVTHKFTMPIPRNLTSEEKTMHEAMGRPMIYVDEPWVPPIVNLPPDWQPTAYAQENDDGGTEGG